MSKLESNKKLLQELKEMSIDETRQSGYEKQVTEFVSEIYSGKIVPSENKLIHPYEIDIYLPELKLGIEFNGLYWHNSDFKHAKYHLNKSNRCAKQGIRLIHIFEDEWIYKRDIIKSKIRHILGNTENKIYARNCTIENITLDDKNKFLEKNYYTGYSRKSSIYKSLYSEIDGIKTCVALMVLSKPEKEYLSLRYDYEITYYATLCNHSVVGGFSKLLHYFELNYSWNNLCSIVDRRYSNDNMFLINGFKTVCNLKPKCWYFNNNHLAKRINEKNFRKEISYNQNNNEDITTKQILKNNNNYKQIYDCGYILVSYERKSNGKEKTTDTK